MINPQICDDLNAGENIVIVTHPLPGQTIEQASHWPGKFVNFNRNNVGGWSVVIDNNGPMGIPVKNIHRIDKK